jgi:hypothetical protein
MKKLNVKMFTIELERLGASDAYKALVLNNLAQYNELVEQHNASGGVASRNDYLMYQLNVQCSKMLLEMQKYKAKTKEDEPDGFLQFVESLKG